MHEISMTPISTIISVIRSTGQVSLCHVAVYFFQSCFPCGGNIVVYFIGLKNLCPIVIMPLHIQDNSSNSTYLNGTKSNTTALICLAFETVYQFVQERHDNCVLVDLNASQHFAGNKLQQG